MNTISMSTTPEQTPASPDRSEAHSAGDTSRNTPLFPGLLLATAVLLAHGVMICRGLVWDDLLILRKLELVGRWQLFAPDPFGFVRPGKTALFSLLHFLFGGRAWGYELAGLAALWLAVLLLWRLARHFLSPAGALAAALLYAVHPLHV